MAACTKDQTYKHRHVKHSILYMRHACTCAHAAAATAAAATAAGASAAAAATALLCGLPGPLQPVARCRACNAPM
jgi:hypothetical protein